MRNVHYYYYTLSPPGMILHYDGQRCEPFECSVHGEVQSHTRPCPGSTAVEEKGEAAWTRTEVRLLTGLAPYRWAKLAFCRERV